jgi:hypothetical protein
LNEIPLCGIAKNTEKSNDGQSTPTCFLAPFLFVNDYGSRPQFLRQTDRLTLSHSKHFQLRGDRHLRLANF